MEKISSYSIPALKSQILEQKTRIKETKLKLEKYKLMKKYRIEHIERLEQKQESLEAEKKDLSGKLDKVLREFQASHGGHTLSPEVARYQDEVNKALEFVKQTPSQGLSYLMSGVASIQKELAQMSSIEQVRGQEKRVYQVHFGDESCFIRSSNSAYCFRDLITDSSLYFSFNPDDCLMKDENGSIWPSNSKLSEELSQSSKLILCFKHGRSPQGPKISDINFQDLASNIKLETRLERMRNWVIDKGKTGKKRGEKHESILKNIFFFVLYFTFLILLYIAVFKPISLRDAYQLNYSLTNMFINQEFPQDCNVPQGLTIDLPTIMRPSQFFCWMRVLVIEQLFNSSDVEFDENKIFILRYNQLGGIRFKQSRVKKDSCQAMNYKTREVDKDQRCFADYESGSKDTQDFGSFEDGFKCEGIECEYLKAFTYSSNPSQGYEIYGKLSTYDKSGFFIDTEQLLVNGTLEYAAFFNLCKFLQNHLWIDASTRAISIHMSFYNINYNYFTNMEILLEFSATGYLTTRTRLSTLHLNYYYDSWIHMKNSVSFFFDKFPEIFCYVYVFVAILPSLVLRLKRNPWVHLKKMWTYLEIILFLLIFGIVIIRVILFFICDTIINTISSKSFTKVTDFSDANFYLSISWAFESFAVLAGSLNLLHYFSIQSMTIIWDTLQRGAKSIFAFFVVFIVLMCSFTQMVHIIYGIELNNFSTFSISISSLFMVLLGSLDKYQEMSIASPILTPIFFIGFMFLMFFVIMNIFVAILNEAYSVVAGFHINSLEKELVGKFKTRLIEEIKIIFGRCIYICKKCLKRKKIERSAAFKAFSRY